MAFWKTRQERIGIFTKDKRKLSVAVASLDRFETLVNDLKGYAPRIMDTFFPSKLIDAGAEASAHRLAATCSRGDDVRSLLREAEELEDISRICDTYPASVYVLIEKAVALAKADACRKAADFWKDAANP